MKRGAFEAYFKLILILFAVSFSASLFTNIWPWTASQYNSYVIQARAWLSGRLDLGRDYPWLEIAAFNGKYYLSFPPFPSYVMLPFVSIFGDGFSGGIIAYASYILSGVYCFRAAKRLGRDENTAILYAVFAVVCSNYFFISGCDWVWFIAQNLCFMLLTAAVYYAIAGKGGVCFAAWACAVGCRPLSIVYLPFLIVLCGSYSKMNKNTFAFKLFKWSVFPVIMGLSYMLLNFLRFGNPIEFGHNYLPEFLEAPNGQFSVRYAFENAKTLIKLPYVSDGVIRFPEFDGMNMFLASPIFLFAVYTFIKGFARLDRTVITAFFVLIAELFFILCHKTMGGWHYGNRYTIDLLPIAFYVFSKYSEKTNALMYAGMILGFMLNFGWMISFFK